MKLTLQKVGSASVLFLYGSRAEIVNHHTTLFNWNATGGELDWFGNTAAYLWTSPARLLKAMTNIHLMRLLGGTADASAHKGKKGGLWAQAAALAKADVDAIPRETDPLTFGAHNVEIYGTGEVTAERPDMDFKDSVLAHAHKSPE